MSDKPQWLKDHIAKLQSEQAGLPREKVKESLQNAYDVIIDPKTGEQIHEPKYTNVFDPDTAPDQQHNWIDRGMKMSCEGAGHPYHQSWKRKNAGAVPMK
jgi:hypothetical protein